MSRENVEIALECFRRFEAGDIDGFTTLVHPDCVLTGPPDWPETGRFVGRDQVIGQFERLTADIEETHFDVEAASAEDGWVIARVRWTGRGSASGLEFQLDLTNTARFHQGQVVESHFRWTRGEALEAAGLSE